MFTNNRTWFSSSRSDNACLDGDVTTIQRDLLGLVVVLIDFVAPMTQQLEPLVDFLMHTLTDTTAEFLRQEEVEVLTQSLRKHARASPADDIKFWVSNKYTYYMYIIVM